VACQRRRRKTFICAAKLVERSCPVTYDALPARDFPNRGFDSRGDSFFQRAKRYDTDMGLREIQHAIETLSSEQQIALLGWLTERDRRQWDSQIERDFSPDGAGMELLNQVKAQIRRGESVRMGNGR
jgi:hypothetical protein